MPQNFTPPSKEEFKSMLRKHDLKATSQRLAVHEAMMELGHASADMVADHVASHSKVKLSQASVYNILAQLALCGIYKHRLSAGNKMFFDVNNTRHMHMYDIVNNRYRDLPTDEIQDLIADRLGRKRFRGYKVEGVDIQIIVRPNKKSY